MCNAWNHPDECTCGFGGLGHLGRRTDGWVYTGSYLKSRLQLQQSLYHQSAQSILAQGRLTAWRIEAFINPNAHCPVCGKAVFFYQSPYGGRVFFDELGPPWPKHPCTDNSTHSFSPRDTYIKRGSTNLPRTPLWEHDHWEPLTCQQIERSTGSVNNAVFIGLRPQNNKPVRFVFPSDENTISALTSHPLFVSVPSLETPVVIISTFEFHDPTFRPMTLHLSSVHQSVKENCDTYWKCDKCYCWIPKDKWNIHHPSCKGVVQASMPPSFHHKSLVTLAGSFEQQMTACQAELALKPPEASLPNDAVEDKWRTCGDCGALVKVRNWNKHVLRCRVLAATGTGIIGTRLVNQPNSTIRLSGQIGQPDWARMLDQWADDHHI